VIFAFALWAGLTAPALTHSVLGLFSIAFLMGIFMFAWHTRAFITSDYFLLLGTSALAVALLQALHLLSYPSLMLLPGGSETSARSLMAAGGLLSISLAIAPTYLGRRLKPFEALLVSIVSSVLLVAAIFMVPGRVFTTASGGTTTGNTVGDVVIGLILLLGLARLRMRGDRLDAAVLSTTSAAVAAAVAAQAAFALEAINPAVAGLTGHIALSFAYYLFFRAVVETGLTRPHAVLFHDLKESEASIREMSLRDDLTGLLNRRGFFSLAEQQTRHSQRTGHNMLLFYCDLDAMKAINDSLGHKEGDRALADVAQLLRETFRDSDIIARFGGDEFVVLAIETDSTSVGILRERLEGRVAGFNETGGRPYQLRLSIGVATYDPLLTETLDEVLSRADAQMYRHKHGRRNEETQERSTAWGD
jgi:diguanylate cyclase (GGDEF)-like protein